MGDYRGMRYQIYKSEDRGHVEESWLKSRHSFSFGSYYNPEKMGFESLRVMNEDWIRGRSGFNSHPHEDMEIFTYVLKGEITHKDNTGSEGVISEGEYQLMRAGSGIVHSEKNKTHDELHLYQIWIRPSEKGLEPGHQQRQILPELKSGKWVELLKPVGSSDDSGALEIYQNVYVSAKRLENSELGKYHREGARSYWVQVVRGALSLNVEGEDLALSEGDGVAIKDLGEFSYESNQKSEVLVFAFMK